MRREATNTPEERSSISTRSSKRVRDNHVGQSTKSFAWDIPVVPFGWVAIVAGKLGNVSFSMGEFFSNMTKWNRQKPAAAEQQQADQAQAEAPRQ